MNLPNQSYDVLHAEVVGILDQARRASARAVNAVMTASYWLVGQRIVTFEQGGKSRAKYGDQVMRRLAGDLTLRYGRGFGLSNLKQIKAFYLAYRDELVLPDEVLLPQKGQKSSGLLLPGTSEIQNQTVIVPKGQKSSGLLILQTIAGHFPLPWSSYVRLLSVKVLAARRFYETEALRGGWTVTQLERQIDSLFYERTALSRNKAKLLSAGSKAKPGDEMTPEAEIKDPFILEFMGLRDEYSESDLEEALILHLERFLLELGGDFTFVGRQRRLRVGDTWYRIDLLFYHRRLRCLVVIDLKTGKFTHADAGQMHLYLNYAKEHWTLPGENPPVGLILCANKNEAVAHYALDNLPNKVMAAEYRMVLPDEARIAEEIERTREKIEINTINHNKGKKSHE